VTNVSARWQPLKKADAALMPAHLLECLKDTGSLTRHLEHHCSGEFSLRLINQSWQAPMRDEAKVLRLGAGSRAMVREINMLCGGVPWVYARSIIPEDTLHGSGLEHIGRRSLGDYLFSEAGARRGRIEIASLVPAEALFQLACPGEAERDAILWGRRSVFRIKNRPLLIVEVFLQDFIQCKNV